MGPYKPLRNKVEFPIPTIGKQWELIDPIAHMVFAQILRVFWDGKSRDFPGPTREKNPNLETWQHLQNWESPP